MTYCKSKRAKRKHGKRWLRRKLREKKARRILNKTREKLGQVWYDVNIREWRKRLA